MAERPQKKATATKKKKRGFSKKKWLYGLFFTAVLAVICGIIGYLLIILNGERILTENASKLELGEASIIYDVDNKEIAKLYNREDNREVAEFSEIPKLMLDAIVATEDQRFHEHSGIDFFAIGRALVKDVIARSAVEGGSTITQQLAKNVFLTADKTFFRKATEASIAVALEHKMSKSEILTMYLNRIYFGKGVYGIKSAADFYFDAELEDLELWQVATLAAMPKGPSRYNPINNPEDSQTRRAVVLKLMYDQKYITETEMNEAKAVVYELPANHEEKQMEPYQVFVDYVIQEAMEVTKLSEQELRVGGFKIYTTLNQQAQKSIEEQFNDENNFEKSKDEKLVQAAMIIIDHRDGTIQGMAGARDYVKKGLNRVMVQRQPGSAIKPILEYGPALESGKYYPWTVLANNKACYGNYCPTDRWGATPVTMQQALKDSRNLAAVWLLNEVGFKEGFAFAKKLGITLEAEDRNLSAALGGLTHGVTPMQMAVAYSVFANGGKSVDAHSILRIEGTDYVYKAPAPKQLMSADTAWYMTEMMQAVVEKGGTGAKAALNRPVAGKTGTTQHGIKGFRGDGIKDAWFVGYTPEWTASVWMGYDTTNMDHYLKKGSSQSAALFGKVMKSAMKDVPKSSFKKPQGIKEDTPPATITNFNAIFIPEEMKVQLSWDPLAEEGNITYEVFRKEASESGFISFVDSHQATRVDDMSAFPGMSYEYYVVAYSDKTKLETKPSQTLKVVIPETEINPDFPMESDPNEPNGGQFTPPGEGGGEVTPSKPGIEPELPEASPGEENNNGGGDGLPDPSPNPPAGNANPTGNGKTNNTLGNTVTGGNT